MSRVSGTFWTVSKSVTFVSSGSQKERRKRWGGAEKLCGIAAAHAPNLMKETYK